MFFNWKPCVLCVCLSDITEYSASKWCRWQVNIWTGNKVMLVLKKKREVLDSQIRWCVLESTYTFRPYSNTVLSSRLTTAGCYQEASSRCDLSSLRNRTPSSTPPFPTLSSFFPRKESSSHEVKENEGTGKKRGMKGKSLGSDIL